MSVHYTEKWSICSTLDFTDFIMKAQMIKITSFMQYHTDGMAILPH